MRNCLPALPPLVMIPIDQENPCNESAIYSFPNRDQVTISVRVHSRLGFLFLEIYRSCVGLRRARGYVKRNG
jgi:hypothetical protein